MIKLKSPEEIEILKEGGKILAAIIKKVSSLAKEGTSLVSLDSAARRLAFQAGAEPAFLNYRPAGSRRPYPASLCASVNDTIVHGVPSAYRLKNGDLLKLDFGLKYEGLFVDAAVTMGIGRISEEAEKLTLAAKEALKAGVKKCRSGKTLGDIGFAINRVAKNYGFKTVKGLTGHGVGYAVHEEPTVLNQGEKGEGAVLKAGLVLALEPMLSAGSDQVVQRADDSFVTADGSLSSHFEHTVAVTGGNPIVLTAE